MLNDDLTAVESLYGTNSILSRSPKNKMNSRQHIKSEITIDKKLS